MRRVSWRRLLGEKGRKRPGRGSLRDVGALAWKRREAGRIFPRSLGRFPPGGGGRGSGPEAGAAHGGRAPGANRSRFATCQMAPHKILENRGGTCEDHAWASPGQAAPSFSPPVSPARSPCPSATRPPPYTIASVSKLTGIGCHALRVWGTPLRFPRALARGVRAPPVRPRAGRAPEAGRRAASQGRVDRGRNGRGAGFGGVAPRPRRSRRPGGGSSIGSWTGTRRAPRRSSRA